MSSAGIQHRSPQWAYVRWGAILGAALQGYWLVASIYYVVEVGLSPLQLLLLGTALEFTILLVEVPTGVLADTVSRKRSLELSMVLIAAAFVVTALSASFGPLVFGTILWGLGYTFTSGADVAWITDELLARGADERTIDRALTTKARWQQRGGAVGIVAFGTLAWLTTLAIAMVAAAVLLVLLACWIAVLFTEAGFQKSEERGVRAKWSESVRILKAGSALVRSDRIVVGLLLVTLLFNLGAEAMDRLTELRLINLGLPSEISPELFFTALGIVGLLAGAALIRLTESRIDNENGPRTVYGAMAMVAALGAVVVTIAPNATVGAFGVFLARGLAWSVLPVVTALWINRSTGSETRATVQSFLGQATSAGQILGGLLLGAIATTSGIAAAIGTSAALFAISGVLILRTGRRSSSPAGL